MAVRDWFTDLRAIRDCSASPETKHLMLVLYTFCRQDSCWPSQETLSVALGVKIRSVQLRLADAKASGWVKVEQRWAPNGQTSNRYILNVDRAISEVGAADCAEGAAGCAESKSVGAAECAPGAQPTTPPPCSPLRPSEVPIELPHEQPKHSEARVHSVARPNPTEPDHRIPNDLLFREVLRHYPRQEAIRGAYEAANDAAYRLAHSRYGGSVEAALGFLGQMVRKYAEAKAGSEARFIPKARKWFEDGQYNDDPATWQTGEETPEQARARMKREDEEFAAKEAARKGGK